MNIQLSPKMIKERVGTVSFKKGDSFFRSNHVTFEFYGTDRCEATVAGVEDFHITIEKDADGDLHTSCSCPKLASFDKDCQHIAAVLLSIYEIQRSGMLPSTANSTNQRLSSGLMNLFSQQPLRSSGHQLHFEDRQVIEAEFICKPVSTGKRNTVLGIEIMIGERKVENIRDFLDHISKGQSFCISHFFSFDPHHHCFQKETDALVQLLIQVIRDEMAYGLALPNEQHDLLPIPTTLWERLLPLLLAVPCVRLEQDGQIFKGLQVSEEPLPLRFECSDAGLNNGFLLSVQGIKKIVILDSYSAVLYEGKVKLLENGDCKRLSELKELLEASGAVHISISQEQIGFFLDKVVPGLRKLGEVKLPKSVSSQFLKSPLIAKLYLDRVKNRLLAGLEFHYENNIINPLDKRESVSSMIVFRDTEKEKEILQLMEESSFARTEEGYFLHNEELEYEFLYHVLPKLQKLVQVYATTAVRMRLFKKNVHPQIRVKVKKERMNWLEFKFEIGGISEQQIREVLVSLEEKRKYYRLHNGSLLSLETKEFAEIQRFLQASHVLHADLANGLDLPIEQCLQLIDTVETSNVYQLEESFRELLEVLHHPGMMKFELPERFTNILRDYQKEGFQWMKTLAFYGFGGILGDDMGLGKTIQSLTFIVDGLSDIRSMKRPVLIVCPSSLMYNWLSEIEKFAPELSAAVIDGNKNERNGLQKETAAFDVLITSYPLLRKDIKWYEAQSFYTVFFDEAQAFKNPLTQTARAVKKLKADYRFALTGTPIENSLEELWSIFHVVFPALFLGLKDYSKLTKENISKRIRPFLLRRLKEDVLPELPQKIDLLETAELLPEQKKLYAAYLAKLRHDTLKHLDKDTIRKNRIKILAGLTRLRQICCHPVLFVDGYKGSSAKFERLFHIIMEAKLSGKRVLIFSQFTKMLALIGRNMTIQDLPFFYLDGNTPSEERVEICSRFNAGERDFFLISLKAGGTGLNLMGADTVILYDTWWNPAVEEQAADRAHRMGQTKAVQVIKLVSRGTIEEKMNELQEKKKHLIKEIIDSDEHTISQLTEEDIREILKI